MLMTASSIDSDSGSSSGNCASGGNRDAGEPSIPGSSRGPGSGTFPGSVSSVSAKAVSPPPASTAALHSRAVVGAVARAWSDDLQDGSTEDEDEDRRLEAAALGVSLTSVSSVADSPPLASTLVPPMAKKGAMKKVEHSAMASAAARGDKENVKKNDATQWTSNVDKWHMQDAENVLTPRGSKRKHAKKGFESDANHAPRQPLAPLRKSSFKRDNSLNAQQVDVPPASIAIQMDQFSHATVNPPTPMPMMAAPTPLKPSNSIKSTTMRMMERSPLLRAQSSIANDPEWGFRGVSEVRPDVKNEFRSLCELSYPVIFTYVLEFLPGIISMTLVGHMDSPKTKEYVGGVSMSTMFMNLTGIAFGFGLATAMDTLCSQAYGAGKPMKMGIYFQCGVLVLGATVIPVFLLNWYTEQFLLMMGQPSEVAQLAGRFSQLILPGIPFLYVYELFKKLLQAQNVVAPMVWIAVISNVVNVVLGVHLTWYTSLGYDGAAIARTIANIVLPGALIPYFMWNPDVVRQWWPGWKLSQAVRHLKTFLTLGIPGMFMMLLEWWAFEIMAAFVGLLPNSVVAISVHSVLSNVSTMAFNFFLGIGVATNIRVGNYVGSNQPEHAKMASVLGMVLSLVVSAALAVVILVTRNVLPMVFINDPLSVKLAAHAFLFLMPYQMLDAVNSVMQGVFRGTGRQKLGAYINLFGYFVIGLPFGVFLAFQCGYGVEGLWLGLTSGIGVAGVMALYKIYYIDWDELADEARVLAT